MFSVARARFYAAVAGVLLFHGGALAQDVVFEPEHLIPTGQRPTHTDSEDFNGDGFADIAVVNALSDTLTLLFGDGVGHFSAPVDYPSGNRPWFIAATTIDSDAILDIAVACGDSDAVAIHYGVGDGTFEPPVLYRAGDLPRSVAVEDFDLDGFPDLLTANYLGNDLTLMRGRGNRQFNPPIRFPAGRRPSIARAADFNGDGYPDFFVGNRHDDNVYVWVSNGAAGFHPPNIYPVGARPYCIGPMDMNGDGLTDLTVENINSNTISLLFGDGTGQFQPAVSYPTYGRRTTAMSMLDVDGDSDTDLALANYWTDDITILVNDGAGVFTYVGVIPGVNAPPTVYAEDLDRDGADDLIATSVLDGTVHVFMNKASLFARTGNVNAAAGEITNVLFVNMSAGDLLREVHVPVGNPVSVMVNTPPSRPGGAGYSMYFWGRAPHPDSRVELPRRMGMMVLPVPLVGGSPQPTIICNNLGREPFLGVPTNPSSPAPATIFSLPLGIHRVGKITIQGIIQDAAARTATGLSITNAVILDVQ